MKRDARFPVMFSKEELRKFQKFSAEKRHQTLSELIRQLLHREIESEEKGQAAYAERILRFQQ
jgi:hypothetical protein